MSARLEAEFLAAAGRELERAGIDAWLLYDVHALNPIAAGLVGLPDGLSRRWFVLLRPGRPPVALAHRIEAHDWREWTGELHLYVGWEELEALLRGVLAGCREVAMEVSERDAVPIVDLVPSGVVELVRDCGPRVVSSAELLARTYAQWGEEGLATNRTAGETLARTARGAYERAAAAVAGGQRVDEHDVAAWVRERLAEAGVGGGGVIAATDGNAALPHYGPAATGSAPLRHGGVLLIDLWGRLEARPAAVFADQTWMGVLGAESPDGFDAAWRAVREARDGAVDFIAERWDGDAGPTGAEVDTRAREILGDHGFGDHILHRTGHAMDRVNHGFGPNLDAVETRDGRRLVAGVGFSVEPGLYFEGRFGIRSEINVWLGPEGPVVTTPSPQSEPWRAG